MLEISKVAETVVTITNAEAITSQDTNFHLGSYKQCDI